MKKIVVTGSSGFIGKNLVRRLKNDGNIVYEPGRNFQQIDCDIIYHLACPSTTEFIINNPTKTMDIIFDVTREALKINSTALFVNASSMGVLSVDNTPQECYNIAKQSMEIYLKYSGRNYINYRIPSVYGLDMQDDCFIKRCVNKKAYKPTDFNKIHYIAHVDDVVDCMVNLKEIQLEQITLGEIYNNFTSGKRSLDR